jgi:16S rRNA (adenine1518-N6/adenine1519-N6)-dimethyltransferase
VLTVQKEVAQRICASSGNMSLLALSVQVYGAPRIALHIPAEAFYPTPAVDSAVLEISIYPTPLIAPSYLEGFFRLVRAGFSQKRKTLRNSLSAGLHRPTAEIEETLHDVGIDPGRRAETLDLNEWHMLSRRFHEKG